MTAPATAATPAPCTPSKPKKYTQNRPSHTHRYAQSDSRLSPEWKARRIALGKGYVCARRDSGQSRAEEGQGRASSGNRDRVRNRSLFWAQNEIEQKFEANKGSTGGTRNEFILFAYVTCFSIVLRGVNVAHCGQPF